MGLFTADKIARRARKKVKEGKSILQVDAESCHHSRWSKPWHLGKWRNS